MNGDSLARDRALLIVRLLIVVYLAELLLNFVRPHVRPGEPVLSIFEQLPKSAGSLGRLLSMPRAVFWTVLAGIVIGAVLQGYSMITRQEGRREAIIARVAIVALLGPFVLIPLTVVFSYPLTALACVPGTVFVLWLLHIGQRFAGVRPTVLLAAFGWGALMVFGVGRAYSGLAVGTIYNFLVKSAGTSLTEQTASLYRTIDLIILHLSIGNELLVAAGVAMLLLLVRHHRVDVMTGLTLGAAIGLGYAFVESILFIEIYGSLGTFMNGATGGFEYWIRQSIGLLGGPVTFGALLGAGMGLAFQASQRGLQRFAAGASLATAIGGAVASEILSGWLSRLVHDHVSSGGMLDTLVISPGVWLLPQAPFIILAVLLLIAGRRARGEAAREAIPAASANGDIAAAEIPVLTDPALRLWAVTRTWRHYGRSTAKALLRLQSAQLDLAAWHWQQSQTDTNSASETDQPAHETQEEGEALRAKVMRLKTASDTNPVATS